MVRPLWLPLICLLLLLSRPVAAQQPYPHLARVVGAIRTAALVARPVSSRHPGRPLELDLALLPPADHARGPRHQLLCLNVSRRIQVRATGDWALPAVTASLGIGVRF